VPTVTLAKELVKSCWHMLCDCARWVYDAVLVPTVTLAKELVKSCWHMLCDCARWVYDAVLVPTVTLASRVLSFAYLQFQQFTRAWWRLLPAGLALQTCIRFGLAILRSPPPAAAAALGYALASFAVGVIAVILVRDLFMRTFAWSDATNRQYVATDRTSEFYGAQSRIDNMLIYVDLGAVAAARWAITNSGNILSLLIQHGATYTAQVMQLVVDQVWQVAQVIWNLVILPVTRKIKVVVLVIWDSPVLSTSAALGALWLLWAHHSGTWRWVVVERVLLLVRTNGLELSQATIEVVFECGTAAAQFGYQWAACAAEVMRRVASNTTTQLVAAAEAGDIESPRLAWVVWIVIVIATKSQAQIRLKTLMWPFVVLWITALLGFAQQLPYVMVAVLCWCGAAVQVHGYEQHERDRVRDQWMQRGGGHRVASRHTTAAAARPPHAAARPQTNPAGEAKERRFKTQTDCSICLESLSIHPDGTYIDPSVTEDSIGMLPCGHAFHTECINEWLQHEARCPLCRQAAYGVDRVLEIVF